jgi:hypothetical protein
MRAFCAESNAPDSHSSKKPILTLRMTSLCHTSLTNW